MDRSDLEIGDNGEHYENTPIQYTVIFHGCKNDSFQMKNSDTFLKFAQNIDCGFSEAVLTSTHNLCFGAKIRKNVYPCKPQIYCIKVGCKRVFVTRTCFRDEIMESHWAFIRRQQLNQFICNFEEKKDIGRETKYPK